MPTTGEGQNVPGRVSLVIPTLDAAGQVEALLTALANQSRRPDEVVVVDSSSTDGTQDIVRRFAQGHPEVSLHAIRRSDFDHGGTRDRALREWTSGDFVLFVTQDALPADMHYVESILAPFADPRVGATGGRQQPRRDARRFEQLVRGFNYPTRSYVRSRDDVERMGIKAFFTSDVCAAYRRSAYLECGGFPSPCMASEDMYMAARLLGQGYLVAYAAEARVYHSHNLTLRQQFERNAAIGGFLTAHRDVLMGASEMDEGRRLARTVAGRLASERRPGELLAFGLDCLARLLGNRAGRRRVLREARRQGA